MEVLVKVILMSILFVFSLCSLANNHDDCINLHVIGSEPIGFINNSGQPSGTHWDYLTLIQNQTGLCTNKNLYPYARIWKSIKQGSHDGGIVFRSESRKSLVEFVAPIRKMKTVVIPLKGIQLNSYDDLKGLTIGKTRGSHLGNKFDQDKNLKIVELTDYNQLAQMIRLGRVDAVAGGVLTLSYLLNKHKTIDKVDLNNMLTLGSKEQWFQLSKKSRHLDKIPKIKEAIVTLQNDGSFDAVMDKYFGKEWRILNN